MIDDFQRHDAVGQQFQRPTHPPLRLGTAGNGDEPGLLFAIEHFFDARTGRFFSVERCVEAFFNQPLA